MIKEQRNRMMHLGLYDHNIDPSMIEDPDLLLALQLSMGVRNLPI
jgi:hypothetical protein